MYTLNSHIKPSQLQSTPCFKQFPFDSSGHWPAMAKPPPCSELRCSTPSSAPAMCHAPWASNKNHQSCNFYCAQLLHRRALTVGPRQGETQYRIQFSLISGLCTTYAHRVSVVFHEFPYGLLWMVYYEFPYGIIANAINLVV